MWITSVSTGITVKAWAVGANDNNNGGPGRHQETKPNDAFGASFLGSSNSFCSDWFHQIAKFYISTQQKSHYISEQCIYLKREASITTCNNAIVPPDESCRYLIQSSHRCAGWRDHIVDKEEESIFRAEVNSLADEEIELADCEIRRHQILLLVQLAHPCFRQLLHNHLHNERYTNRNIWTVATKQILVGAKR